MDSDLRALGLYNFKGSCQYTWLSSWPETHASLVVAVYAGVMGQPVSVDGALQEWSRREHANDAGVISGGSGDGAIVKTAAWHCPP